MLNRRVRIGLALAVAMVLAASMYVGASPAASLRPGVTQTPRALSVASACQPPQVRVSSVHVVKAQGHRHAGTGEVCPLGVIPAAHDGPASLLAGVGIVIGFVPLRSPGEEDPPDHPLRRRILEEVRKSPGIRFRQVLRILDVGIGDLSYHLHRLVRAETIVAVPSAGRLYFYDALFRGPREAFMLTPRERQILEALRLRPGSPELELMTACGLGPSTLSRHLHRLRAGGWVEPVRQGRRLRWYALK